MRFNEKEIAAIVSGSADHEGRLNYCKTYISSGSQCGVYKDRYFKLKHNLLFYFRISEQGRIDFKQPVGLFVLENSSIQYEMYNEAPFAFSIVFCDEPDKKHMFSGRCEENTQEWMAVLKKATYEYLRSKLITLQTILEKRTGRDPLLMFPRNQGVIRGSENSIKDPFETRSKEKRIGARTSTFQSHILKSSSVVDIVDTPPTCPPRRSAGLARSATTAAANVQNSASLSENSSSDVSAPVCHPQNLIELCDVSAPVCQPQNLIEL